MQQASADMSRTNPSAGFSGAVGRWIDEHPRSTIVLLCAAYAAFSVPLAWAKPLWHDELFTYYLALFPNVPSMLQAAQKIDLNPPLLYLLDFFTLRLPGVLAHEHTAAVAARLPSLVGGLVASLGIFAWLRSRIGALYACVGAGVLWNTVFIRYAVEDRPYALLLAATVLLMLARDSPLRQQRRSIWILVNFAFALIVAALHFMGAFVLLAFLGAEAVEWIARRHADILVALSYLLPFGVLVLYHHVISGYGTLIFPSAFTPSIDTPVLAYAVVGYFAWIFAAVAGLIWLTRASRPKQGASKRDAPQLEAQESILSARERALLLFLFLEPLVAMAALWRSQAAFFARYGLPACIPIAIWVAFLLRAALRNSERAALIAIILLCAQPAYTALRNPALLLKGQIGEVNPAPSLPDYHRVEPNLPFVAASGLTYVEMNHRESAAFLHRVYYLTDTAAATEYAHATLFEQEEAIRKLFHFPSQVEPLRQFESEYPRFLVLGTFNYPEDWLLRKLKADGDDVRFLGNYVTSYKDQQLYEITLPSAGR
jgi:hypothetical protein